MIGKIKNNIIRSTEDKVLDIDKKDIEQQSRSTRLHTISNNQETNLR